MSRRRHAGGTRTGRGRISISIARAFARSRGAGTRRWAAFSTARQRRTWKVKEAWIPSPVFGSDSRSAGCAEGGGTVGAVIGGGRHEDGAARGDVGDDFFAVIGGVKKAGWMDLQYKKLLLSSKKIRNKSI